MILNLWVFFMLGDSLVDGEPPAYEHQVVSSSLHDRNPQSVERAMGQLFREVHPHHVVCDSGWCRQEVKVNPV